MTMMPIDLIIFQATLMYFMWVTAECVDCRSAMEVIDEA